METNVHAPQEKPASVPKRYSWAYSWTWRHNVVLLESVAAALPKALGHWSFEKRKKMAGWMFTWDDWKSYFLFFFDPWRAKSIHRAGRKQFFDTWVTRLPAEMNVHIASTTNTSISSLSFKKHISNHHPYKGGESTGCLVFTQRNLYTKKSWHREACTHRGFYTEKPFTQSSFFTEELLHRGTFTQTSLYTQRLWHREVSLLHREAFAHRSFYTAKTLTQRSFYTQKLVRKETFTNRNFYTQRTFRQKLLHTEAFTPKNPLHEESLPTEAFTHTEAFTQRNFYTQKILHTEAFTHREVFSQKKLYTEELVHKEACTHRRVYTRIEAFVQRSFYPSLIMCHFWWSFTLWHLDIFVFMLFWPAPSVV